MEINFYTFMCVVVVCATIGSIAKTWIESRRPPSDDKSYWEAKRREAKRPPTGGTSGQSE